MICGCAVGVVARDAFVALLFTAAETEEVKSLKALVLSVTEKAPGIITESVFCEAFRNRQKSALESFTKNA